jgi:hypothetical protein
MLITFQMTLESYVFISVELLVRVWVETTLFYICQTVSDLTKESHMNNLQCIIHTCKWFKLSDNSANDRQQHTLACYQQVWEVKEDVKVL